MPYASSPFAHRPSRIRARMPKIVFSVLILGGAGALVFAGVNSLRTVCGTCFQGPNDTEPVCGDPAACDAGETCVSLARDLDLDGRVDQVENFCIGLRL